MNRRKRFGEVLLEEGVIRQQDLDRALVEQAVSGKRLGQIIEESGIISEQDIAVVLARQFGLKTIKNISQHHFSASLLDLVDSQKALEKLIFPLKVEEKKLYLAMVNPLDMETLDTLSFATGLRVIPFLTTPKEIHEAINTHYLKNLETPTFDGQWRLLLIDAPQMLKAAQTALEPQGYRIATASKSSDALMAVQKNHPHLIICEIQLSGFDGVQFFQSLRKIPHSAAIPVIAQSFRATASEEAQLLDMGFFDFIAKPINGQRLAARVRRALRLVYQNPALLKQQEKSSQ